jgi:hypothetical protein
MGKDEFQTIKTGIHADAGDLFQRAIKEAARGEEEGRSIGVGHGCIRDSIVGARRAVPYDALP